MTKTRALLFAAVGSLSVASSAFVTSSALAQHEHHRWCLRTGGGSDDCAYNTHKQCMAARTGTQTCVRNTPTMNHR
jgi:hypothetical protein